MNAPTTRESDPLHNLFRPRAVAVVGASAQPGKWGHQFAAALQSSTVPRDLYFVNANGGELFGRECLPSVDLLPAGIDVAFLCVPADQVEPIVEHLAAQGCRYFICVSAGFAEVGADGRKLEQRVVETARRHGARLVGPNCAGVYDARSDLRCIAWARACPGSVGVISQSGMIIMELAERLRSRGLGLSRAISVGNQADLSMPEYLDSFARDEATRVIVVYPESFQNGRVFFRAVERCVAAGKAVILLAPGTTDSVRRAAASHTGSLLSDTELVEAACYDVGAIRVRSMHDAVIAVQGLLAPTTPRGFGVALFSDGGGAATLGADAAERAGFTLVEFSIPLQDGLRKHLSASSGVSNPVDAARFVSFAKALPALQIILASGEVDCLCLAGMFFEAEVASEAELAAVDALVSMARTRGVWLGLATMAPGTPGAKHFAGLGVPVFDFPDEMFRSLSLVRSGRRRRSVVAIDEPASGAPDAIHWDYISARAELARYGLTFNPCEAADTWEAVQHASRRIGFPVALKALASSHKSDSGGVALNITDETTLRLHFERMVASIGWARFSVERMVDASGAVEILLGAVRDVTFGPIVAIGIGGTLAELHRDTVFALAPVDRDFAFDMMDRLRGARLLRPYRGRRAIDRERIADAVVALSRFMLDRPGIAEAEINPLLAGATEAIAVDARVRATSTQALPHG